MRHYDHGIVKVDQKFFQPSDSIQIQMVRRLIQKQDVRVAKQCLGKKNFYFIRARKVLHHGVMEFGTNSKSIQKCSGIGLGFPSVHGCKLAFQFAGTDSIFISKIFFGIEYFFFFHNLVQSGIAHDDRIKNHVFIIFKMILLKK